MTQILKERNRRLAERLVREHNPGLAGHAEANCDDLY